MFLPVKTGNFQSRRVDAEGRNLESPLPRGDLPESGAVVWSSSMGSIDPPPEDDKKRSRSSVRVSVVAV